MSEGVDTIEIGIQTNPTTSETRVVNNPFPEDARDAVSQHEKFKLWIKEQGERDKQAAQLMRMSKKQRRRTSVA